MVPVTDANQVKSVAGPVFSDNGWRSCCEVDAGPWASVTFTIQVTGQTISWRVFGAHEEDYSDEVAANGIADVIPGDGGAYSAAPPPYHHYRVKIKSATPNMPGLAKIVGVAKAA